MTKHEVQLIYWLKDYTPWLRTSNLFPAWKVTRTFKKRGEYVLCIKQFGPSQKFSVQLDWHDIIVCENILRSLAARLPMLFNYASQHVMV